MSEKNGFLAERWLSECAPNAQVRLLAPPPALEAARRLAERFRIVADVERLDDTSCGEPLAPESFAVLPISFETVPLRFKPETRMPVLPPYYPLLRQLWHRGFRTMELYSLSGCCRLRVPHLLDEFRDRHRGRRCFVAGNGPSLNAIDMTRLKDELVFGSNQCYLGYEKWGFQFPFWGIYDQLQIQEYGPEYAAKVPPNGVQFFPFEYLPLLRFPEACPVNILWPRKAEREFSNDPTGIFRGHTVTYMLLQIAAVMGCNPIILIGADHHFPLTRRFIPSKTARRARRWITRRLRDTSLYNMADAVRQEWIEARFAKHAAPQGVFWNTKDAAGPTHFDPNYTQQGNRLFLPPEPEEMDRDYRCARQWADAHGVSIVNASPGSALDVFPKVSYDELF